MSKKSSKPLTFPFLDTEMYSSLKCIHFYLKDSSVCSIVVLLLQFCGVQAGILKSNCWRNSLCILISSPNFINWQRGGGLMADFLLETYPSITHAFRVSGSLITCRSRWAFSLKTLRAKAVTTSIIQLHLCLPPQARPITTARPPARARHLQPPTTTSSPRCSPQSWWASTPR